MTEKLSCNLADVFVGKFYQGFLSRKISNAANCFKQVDGVFKKTQNVGREKIDAILIKQMVMDLFVVESHLAKFKNSNDEFTFRASAERRVTAVTLKKILVKPHNLIACSRIKTVNIH